MKKIITVLLVMLSFVVLVACQEADTVKPVIHGADNVSIEQGTAFDPLAGVTATDNVDGDIALTASNVTGAVNVNIPEVYTLVYTVKDKAGNVGNKERKVTVTAKGEEGLLGNLVGGDFSGNALGEGWSTWYDSSAEKYEVEYSVADGAAVIDIKKADATDTQWWGVQLAYKAIMLDPFVSYKLTFRVKADLPRYMNHQIQGGGIEGGKAYGEKNFTAITTDWVTVEKDFYVRSAAVNAELQFSFGNMTDASIPEELRVVATKIYIDDVKIVAGPELENSAPAVTAKNLIIPVGQATNLKKDISVVDDFTTININDVQVVQKSPETAFDPASPKHGFYVFEVTATDEEGLSTTVTRTINVAVPWNRPINFTVTGTGGWDVNNNPEIKGWFLREVEFTEGVESWIKHDETVTDATAITVEAVPEGDWKSSFRMDQVQFFAGTYVITFDIKAEHARVLNVVLEQAGLDNAVAFQYLNVTTEWQTITLTYEFATDQFNKAFEFYFGTLSTNRLGLDPNPYDSTDDVLTTVLFKNFNVVYTAPNTK